MKVGPIYRCLGLCKLLQPLVEQLALIDTIIMALPVCDHSAIYTIIGTMVLDLRWLHTTNPYTSFPEQLEVKYCTNWMGLFSYDIV